MTFARRLKNVIECQTTRPKDNSPRTIRLPGSVISWLVNAQFSFKTWTTWRRWLVYIDGFSAAKRYQQRIACCYENCLAYFLCGFLGGNENFEEIKTGSLSRLAASPLDFVSALCSNFQKDWFQTRRKFTYFFFVWATRSTSVRIFVTASQLSRLKPLLRLHFEMKHFNFNTAEKSL